MISAHLPLIGTILAVTCLGGWTAFQWGESWQRASKVISDAERDVARSAPRGALGREPVLTR